MAVVTVDTGSWVTLEANGASVSNLGYAEANDATFSRTTDGGARPDIECELEFTNSANASGAPFISIFSQSLDLFGGTDDALPPSATNTRKFRLSEATAITTTGAQRMTFLIRDVPPLFALYLYNGTGQTIAAGWKLRVRGYSYIA